MIQKYSLNWIISFNNKIQMNLNDYFKTKFSCLIFISWIFLSCTSDTSTEIKFDYTISSIDIVNNQMDVTFTITNSTKVDLDEQN